MIGAYNVMSQLMEMDVGIIDVIVNEYIIIINAQLSRETIISCATVGSTWITYIGEFKKTFKDGCGGGGGSTVIAAAM